MNFNAYLEKADDLIIEADNIRNAVAILSKYHDNDNRSDDLPNADQIPPTVEPIAVSIVTDTVKLNGARDTALINALTSAYKGSLSVWEDIGGASSGITRSNAHGRLKTLHKRHPHLIEKHPQEYLWRRPDHDQSDDVDTVKPKVVKRSAKAMAKKVTGTVAENDNHIVAGLHCGDGLELMKAIPDCSVDLILCDPPFSTCRTVSKGGSKIDEKIDLEAMFAEYRRIIKPQGNILIFGSQPFTTDVINAGRDWHKYNLIWRKDKPTGFDHARNKPLKDFEDIAVFTPAHTIHARKEGERKSGTTANRATYNPWRATAVRKRNNPKRHSNAQYTRDIKVYPGHHYFDGLEDCPRMVLEYPKEMGKTFHPFQKPQALLDDLIRMYSNEGEVVLDNCVGGGSTVVAAINADRRWIAFEQAPDVYEIAKARIEATITEAA